MKKQAAIFIISVFLSLSLWGTAMAQLDREIQILEAFYSKDDLVTTTTRFPKPRSWTADNVTVITAEEIEAMSAHTVADVLKYIPGVFIDSSQGFGATSLITVQGSEDRHVLVLLDGVRWNFISGGNAETNTIPIGIIDRIEIIKGPASSAWGSSLGGLVNIITKPAGTTRIPSGVLQVSYAEAGSLDAGAHLSGKAGPLGYYLFAGRQESGGLKKNRSFDNNHLFSKFRLQLPEDNALTLSLGYSEPKNDFGVTPSADIASDSNNRNFFANATFNADIRDSLKLNATAFVTTGNLLLGSSALGLGVRGTPNELYLENSYKETRSGGSGQLVWLPKNQTVVLGTEMFFGHLDQTTRSGSFLQEEFGAPAISETASSVDEWAMYVNDTILFGNVSITSGLRFDYNTISGSFVSPSLGVTYEPATGTLIRGTVSRGFQYPPLGFSRGGGLFLDPNPDLEPEQVWSYQLGLETAAFRSGLVKINFFHYRQQDLLDGVLHDGSPTNNGIYVNKGSAARRGVEVEFKSKPVFHVALSAGGAYVRTESLPPDGGREMWNYSLTLEYDNKRSLSAFLKGNFVDQDSPAFYGSKADSILWDFTIQKKISRNRTNHITLFLTAHNLFNESQYDIVDYKNPSRWVEAAVKWAY
jgi:vitamin B12 transporter